MKREFSIAALILFLALFSAQRLSAQLDNLVIQEYVDWNGGDGLGIKIYNPTPNPINLSGYRIAVYNNGNTSANSTGALTGIINPGEIFITGNSGYCFTNCSSSCDQSLSITGVNDGDVVRLEQNGTAIDAIGCVGYSGNFTMNGNLVTGALKWVKLTRPSDNCTRYFENDGVSPNSWPNSTASNFEGWEVSIPSCLSTDPWNYTPEETVTSVSICATDSIEINGIWISESGTYSTSFQNDVLCDSIVSTIVIVLPDYYETQSLSICEGETAFLEGAFQNTAGVYFDTLTTIAGCDSIIETTLQIMAAPNNSINVELCYGDSLLLEGNWIKTPGTYTQNVTVGDCTFSENVELTFLPAPTDQFLNVSGCGNAEYNGITYTSNTEFVDTLTSIFGCDSAFLHITIAVNTIDISIAPVDPVCPETPFEINATSSATLIWDNNTSGESATYTLSTGRYIVVSAVNGDCSTADSVFVNVISSPQLNGDLAYTSCQGTAFQAALFIEPDAEILWTPAQYLSADDIPNPMINAENNIVYTVLVGNTCDTISATVSVISSQTPNLGLTSGMFSICEGDSLHLTISDPSKQAVTISPATTSMVEPNAISLFPMTTTPYTITAQNACGNESIDIDINVLNLPILPEEESRSICEGTSVNYAYSTEPNTEYLWIPEQGNQSAGSAVLNPTVSTNFILQATNACGTKATRLDVEVDHINLSVSNDTTICPGDMAILHASGGESYAWTPARWIDNPLEPTTLAFPESSTQFQVTGKKGGCTASEFINVNVAEAPILNFNTIEILPGGSVDLSDYFEDYQIVLPTETQYIIHTDTVLKVDILDPYGCTVSSNISVKILPTFYAPNAFTPDGDGLNDIWKVIGPSIEAINIQVFDRWGGLVFKSTDIKQGWNGDNKFAKGEYYCEPGIYSYSIKATLPNQKAFESLGSITLIR